MNIRTKLRSTYGISITLLLLVVICGYAGMKRMHREVDTVVHRDSQIIANSHQIMKLVVDMETGQRGFVITGKEAYLAPYHNALLKIDTLLDEQRELVKDQPDQVARLERVQEAVQKWQDEAGQPEIQTRRVIATRETLNATLQNSILSGQGKATFDQLREAVAPMLQAFERDGNRTAVHLLTQFEKAMVDRETGLRGYLLTGKESFLEPFHAGGTNASANFVQLHVILETAHDRTATKRRVEQLGLLLDGWLAAGKSGSDTGLLKQEQQRKEMVGLLDELGREFEIAKNITLVNTVKSARAALADTAQAHRQLLANDTAANEQAFAQSQTDVLASFAEIGAINDRAYDLEAMTTSLAELEALSDHWAQQIALPKIQLRREINETPQTLETLADQLEQGQGKQILDKIRGEVAAFIQTEEDRLEKRVEQATGYTSMITGINLAIGVTGMILTCLFAVMFTRIIARPIVELSKGIDAIAKGDRGQRVAVHSNDELGTLAESFNNMASQLMQLEQDQLASNEALSEAKDTAEAANRSKSDFLANMSHEIRTPMNAILGFTDLLKSPSLSDEDRGTHIDTIQRNSKHLMRLINDILDLSKIESGKMDIEKIATKPAELVSEITSLMRPKAQENGIRLEVAIADELPENVETDPVRLRQILLNLLSNAVKFTRQGTVRLEVGQQACDEPGMTQLDFTVVDTGIGLSPEQIGKLFKPFTQADTSMTRRFGGTGLGLSLCKHFAEMLDGSIAVESTEGVGSRFAVSIPVKSVAADQGKPMQSPRVIAPDSTLQGRVLLAEDGKDNQRLIMFHLKKMGLNVEVCENGQDAMDLALEQRDAGTPFDIILMDMQMPIMDGYTATQRLREQSYTGPIIALTAHAMTGDREKCLAAGCDEYTTKPIDKTKIHALLSAALEQRRAA